MLFISLSGRQPGRKDGKMMKKTIAVLFGGCSPEYPVSLQSAYAVLTSVDAERYEVIPVGITREGEWFRFLGKPEDILTDEWSVRPAFLRKVYFVPDRSLHGFLEEHDGWETNRHEDSRNRNERRVKKVPVDAVFPVLHGKNGEDGTVQGLLELAGIPVVGCGMEASALCMDKYRAHLLVSCAGIPVPRSVLLSGRPQEAELIRAAEGLGWPLFVKPLRAGSSFGITRAGKQEELADAVRKAFEYDSEVLIEEYVDGFEVGCAVLGTDRLTVGRVDEIELSEGFFDYTEKYTLKTSRIHMPARISPETESRIQECAKTIYRILGCSGFARVDLFLRPDGTILFNEVNTIPGFTAHSRYPGMMRGAGISFAELVDRLISQEV